MVTSSGTCLLDANVLLALAWPQHAHHARAHDWFAQEGATNWASCAMTQMAFVRVSSNPRLTASGTTPRIATELLQQLVALPGHRYLSECPPLVDSALFLRPQLIGHNQVTDLYLLHMAVHHHCRLATFDKGIPELLATVADRERWVCLVG